MFGRLSFLPPVIIEQKLRLGIIAGAKVVTTKTTVWSAL